ncbi:MULTISPECIES: tyrosine-type recombinase/integrase [unclassified Variovorax]|uniref:tyrosine-type recombinase/integrase n=1 Tax=unclassified Variovorax TaxID=663243 RepID=UPI002576E40B|nr:MULTISPECIES: tyrosine-type recombinase/integrase [unclassified Variovorax]MDM0086891.1 tyrosine-type recombinase/integrase [Variovorax sp. J22G40]MDM0144853.1 tyrosine-type recombinase/integrase [Variovorax sp. J2P1-31]
MGTITKRKRADGSVAHIGRIRIKEGSLVVHRETETFDREAEPGKPGALEKVRAPDPTLAETIQKYIDESRRELGTTKAQVLKKVAGSSLAKRRGSTITSANWVQFGKDLGVQPQTVGNYFSHISSIYSLARPAWNYPLDPQVCHARKVSKSLGLTSRSRSRNRRQTLEELHKLMTHFGRVKRKHTTPTQEIICYAIFSTRRQEEITTQTFEDLDEAQPDLLVRDMKHPGEKEGNDVRCSLTPEALAIVLNRRKSPEPTGRIFPYNSNTISRLFSDARTILGIEDLHFHDLRYDGISRLFELGWNIPHVAGVSGHRTWKSASIHPHSSTW